MNIEPLLVIARGVAATGLLPLLAAVQLGVRARAAVVGAAHEVARAVAVLVAVPLPDPARRRGAAAAVVVVGGFTGAWTNN